MTMEGSRMDAMKGMDGGRKAGLNSANPVVAAALNAISNPDREFSKRYEAAFRKAAKSCLEDVERGLMDLTRVTTDQADAYDALPADIRDRIKGWLGDLSTVRAVIHRLR